MALNLACGHPACVQREDFFIEARPARLMFADNLRLERAVAVPRRLQFDLAEISLQLLLALPIARVAAVMTRRIVLLIAEMLGHLRLHGTLQQGLCQLLQQPIFASYVLRSPAVIRQ